MGVHVTAVQRTDTLRASDCRLKKSSLRMYGAGFASATCSYLPDTRELVVATWAAAYRWNMR